MNVTILKEKLDALANAIGIKAKKRVPQTIEELIETVELIKTDPNLQSKVISPTTTAQVVTADSGYDGLADVKVKSVQLQNGLFDAESTHNVYTPGLGFIGFSSVEVNIAEQNLPTSATGSNVGNQKIADISASSYTRFLNIPKGFNPSAKYYVLSGMDSIIFPTEASTNASGIKITDIAPSETSRYIIIPPGYNNTTKCYKLNAVSSYYIGSSINVYNGEINDEWIYLYNGRTGGATDWSTNSSNTVCSTYLPINSDLPVSFTSNTIYRIRITLNGITATFQRKLGDNSAMESTSDWRTATGWSIHFTALSGAQGYWIKIETGTAANGGSGILAGKPLMVEALV